MDPNQIADILEKSWKAYSHWKADHDKKHLREEVRQLRSELEALKLHATVRQAAEIEVFGKLLDGSVSNSVAHEIITERKRLASIEAQKLRGLLLANMYDPMIRRLYLSSRTSVEIDQDRVAGRAVASGAVRALIVLLPIFGGFLGIVFGFLIGAEWQQNYALGLIPSGRELKSVSLPWIFSLGLTGTTAGLGLGLLSRRGFADGTERLWADFGPIPDELILKGSDKIRQVLMSRD